MPNPVPGNFIDTKEILLKTGISRATLNNYIKMEIVPRPIVQKPITPGTGAKKIGYFPPAVIARIEQILLLKREGNSMENIVNRLRGMPVDEQPSDSGLETTQHLGDGWVVEQKRIGVKDETLKFTIENVRLPAYLLDYSFRVQWINDQADDVIFGKTINLARKGFSGNVFELFFQWEFHKRVRNWKDMIAFHLSFVKIKYAKSWMENLYQGISKNEIAILQEIYDTVGPFEKKTINDMTINLLAGDGRTRAYKVYTLFTREGILFMYRRLNFLDENPITLQQLTSKEVLSSR